VNRRSAPPLPPIDAGDRTRQLLFGDSASAEVGDVKFWTGAQIASWYKANNPQET
jgi:hypothetical protein